MGLVLEITSIFRQQFLLEVCVCDVCLFHHSVMDGTQAIGFYIDVQINSANLHVVCGRLPVGVWISQHELSFDWVISGTEDLIEALVVVEILTRTDRPKPLPLLKEKNSNSKTSQATLTNPFTNISDTRLYKLAQQLQQRLMNRIIQQTLINRLEQH